MEGPLSKPVIDGIIRSGRKTVALVVTADARLIVRAPYRASMKYIEDLVAGKQKWIIEKQQAARLRNAARVRPRVTDGEELLFLGEPHRLETRTGRARAELQPGRLALRGRDDSEIKALLEALYRKQAKRVLSERTAYYSGITGLRPRSVGITGARRRWGSCGPKNTLNFAWRLVMAPLEVIDYVVVHELAHIEFKNHSAAFWKRVAEVYPGYERCKTWLADNQKLMELL